MTRKTLPLLLLALITAGAVHAQPGSLDLNFDGDGEVFTQVGPQGAGYAVIVQPDDRIVVGGTVYNTGSSKYDVVVVRYLPDGSLDNSFGNQGITIVPIGGYNSPVGLALQADGRIVIAGNSYDDFAVMRFTTSGTLDPTFGGDGVVTTSFASGTDIATSIAVQPDGRLVVAGSTTGLGEDFALARYNTDGSLDNTFSFDGKLTTAVSATYDDGANAVAVAADGSIVAVGSVGVLDGLMVAVVRYAADGTLASGFGTNGIEQFTVGTGNIANMEAVALQGDQRIVLAGYAVVSGAFRMAAARLNTDGTFDLSFAGTGTQTTAVGTGVAAANGLAIQADGKLVLAGGSDQEVQLLRYATDGTIDFSFGSGGTVITDVIPGLNDTALGIAIQADGKIVVAGKADDNGTDSILLLRYLSGLNIGINEVTADVPVVRAYPDPAEDHLTVEWPKDALPGAFTCTVLDAQGRVLAVPFLHARMAAGSRSIDLPLIGLPSGALVLRVAYANGSVALPFVKL